MMNRDGAIRSGDQGVDRELNWLNYSDCLGDHGEATATSVGGGSKETEDYSDDVETEDRGGA